MKPREAGGADRPGTVRLSRFELELMDVLWRLGQASIREVQDQLPEERRPAYTTVQTIVNRLEEKGAVRRAKKVSNAHIYEPVATRVSVHRRLIDDFLRLFGGSPAPLMARLVETGQLSLEDLRSLERAVEEQQAEAARAAARARRRRGGVS